MKLENEFVVNVPIERAWEVLTDIPEIAPCLPGARLTGQDGDVYSGKVKIKVGPVTAEYAGTADFLTLDKENYHVDIDAKGRDSRGSGNASAVITADMTPVDGGTKVEIHTDLKVAGKVAQFGKGVIGDVSKKLIDQFVACIEAKLDHDGSGAEEAIEQVAAASAEEVTRAADVPAAAEAPTTRTFDEPDGEMEALDLMDAAGGAVVKRVAPLVAVGAVVALIIWLITRG
ncbi:MAG: SRPBCC family protein [Acidimicrobiales bacterium]|nr:SRPBCC family protein [Acidimicrobiales bacterium]